MTTLQTASNYVSTFLSHSSDDSALAIEIAKRLGWWGVLTWIDKNELREMGSLSTTLEQAIKQQSTLTIFLSKASSKSEWCKDELRWALEAYADDERLLPVYLGNPLKLVQSHDLLATRFLNPDGDRVDRLGATCKQDPKCPDLDAIAEKIAFSAYKHSIPSSWSDLVIFLDQRGTGLRRGQPELLDNVARLNAPILTFRPSLKPRRKDELLTGKDWENMVTNMTKALSSIPGNIRNSDTRKVRVLGYAQTGLMWAIGKQFDRTNNIELYGYGRLNEIISNKGQDVLRPLAGGNSDCAQLVSGEIEGLGLNQREVALYVGTENYLQDVQSMPNLDLFWIKTDKIADSKQAMQLVADIIASIKNLYQKHNVRELSIFWGTANHVALLTAANLTEQHAFPKIKYMERDHANRTYVHLPMPSN